MIGKVESILAVRRSIHIDAPPARVWQEFESFERMKRWWGLAEGTPEAGSGRGQRLMTYEPRLGGRIEMEVEIGGQAWRYGGVIIAFDRERELTFESDWIPNRGWLSPTLVTLRLTPMLGGTLVELLHHGFERASPTPSDDHAAYEGGWSMTQLAALRKAVAGA